MSFLSRFSFRENWPLWVARSTLVLSALFLIPIIVNIAPPSDWLFYPLLLLRSTIWPFFVLLFVTSLAVLLTLVKRQPEQSGCVSSVFWLAVLVVLIFIASKWVKTNGDLLILGILICVALVVIAGQLLNKHDKLVNQVLKILFISNCLTCSLTAIVAFSGEFYQADVAYLNDHMYRLTISSIDESGCIGVSYDLYECDSIGLLCRFHQSVKWDRSCSFPKVEIQASKLVIDLAQNRLYAKIDNQILPINP